jgi:hypothetical protein
MDHPARASQLRELLAALRALDPDDPDFRSKFASLKQRVEALDEEYPEQPSSKPTGKTRH